MTLSVVIPYYNGERYIEPLLKSIPTDIQVTIVDDLSEKPLNLNNKTFTNTRVIRLEKKGWYAGAVNRGVEESPTDKVIVVNQDALFTSVEWIPFFEAYEPDVAIAGAGMFKHPAWPAGYVVGTCMMVSKRAFLELGGLNVRDYPLWGGCCEFQLRAARKGWKVDPVENVPGFTHLREEGEAAGTAIKSVMKVATNSEKGLLIRTPPMISVIVPCHNHGRFLPDVIASLVGGSLSIDGAVHPGQSFQSFEVIMVDDGSSDGSWEVMKGLADPKRGLRALKLDRNVGKPAALNQAIKRASGTVITIIDADDWREPDALERMFRVLQETPHSFVYDDMIYIDEQGNRQKVALNDYDFDKLLERNQAHTGIMFPRRAWEEIGGYAEVMKSGREDWAVNVALGVKGYCGIHLRGYHGYIYRRHSSNRTLTNTTPSHRAAFHKQLQGLFPKIYQGERPMGCCGNKGNPLPTAALRTASLTGEQGLVEVEYMGANYGNTTHYGPVSGTRYTFSASPSKKVKQVDVRDLQTKERTGILDKYENGRPLFRVVDEKKAENTFNKVVAAVEKTEPKQVEPAALPEASHDPSLPPEFGSPARILPAAVAAEKVEPKEIAESKETEKVVDPSLYSEDPVVITEVDVPSNLSETEVVDAPKPTTASKAKAKAAGTRKKK